MAYVFNMVGGGSDFSINGAIEQYIVQTGSVISAGDFVQHINSLSSADFNYSGSELNSSANAGTYISAAAIDDTRVFIAHSLGDYYLLYGMICTINGGTITAGTDTQLSTQNYSAIDVSVVALSTSKVFVGHGVNGSSYELYGMICNISGNVITVETDASLSAATNAGRTISIAKLSSTSVFIAHQCSSSSYLYGMVCTISDNSITAGTDVQLSSVARTGNRISAVALSASSVFIAHNVDYNNYYLYGMVVTISGNSITAGTDVQLSSVVQSGFIISAAKIDNSSVFISHSYGSTYNLYGMVAMINGGSIATGADTQLSAVASTTSMRISTICINSSTVFVVHGSGSQNTLRGMVCTISNNTEIAAGTDVQLSAVEKSGSKISAVTLDFTTIFTAHCYNGNINSLYGSLTEWAGSEYVGAYTDSVFGVAKTGGVAGTTIDVYVPNATQ